MKISGTVRLFAAVVLMLAAVGSAWAKDELVVYTYESLDWVKKDVVPSFEKKYQCTVKVVKFTDAGNIVSRLKLEKKNPKADVVLGLTPALVSLAKKEGLLQKYRSPNISRISDKSVVFDADYATPYDYGALAFVYNPEKLAKVPASFEDICAMKKGIIIEDPRTSSTGQDFLLWTVAVYGDGWKDFWRKLKGAVLTVTPGWNEAFAKFEAGEAPVMLSYATDGAYSWENYKSEKYKAFIPSEGGFLQIESGSLVNGTSKVKLAQAFIDNILMEPFQKQIPLNQWMFPVTNVPLPDSFKKAVRPAKTVSLPQKDLADKVARYLKEWEELYR
ncbi:MAG TPA: thiamine ABC transporter substrate-binding protein [Spirochaetota bacterium]|nr:thiamine ABC transporter substrate-binding protein [Spirochaetota bacterium]